MGRTISGQVEFQRVLWSALAIALSAGCSGPGHGSPGNEPVGTGGTGGTGGSETVSTGGLRATGASGPGAAGDSGVGGTAGGTTVPDQVVRTLPSSLTQALETAAELDTAALTAAYPAPTQDALGYDPTEAQGLDLIQKSALALNDAELSILGDKGFVITRRQEFPSYAYGYQTIYLEDLPVYVSADSVLQAVHTAFDNLLAQTERAVLVPSLVQLLTGMRARIATQVQDTTLAADVDFYLSVALSLLNNSVVAPVSGASQAEVEAIFALAQAAEGHRKVVLFGTGRDEDFSQFKPRGHYTNSPELANYFKAMMWLGRVDLRLLETQSDGTQLFRRSQFNVAAGLNLLLGEAESGLFKLIDETVGAYVGEHDDTTPLHFQRLLQDLKVSQLSDLDGLSDEAILDQLGKGEYGAQRIASRLITIGVPKGEAYPLDMSYRLFGQRYTVDSHVFSNTTFDRIADRMMPSPLDAAFAALGNNAALPVLGPELENTAYRKALTQTRVLVDAHEPAYWEGSVYTRWLDALRALSPGEETSVAGITVTPDWNARILSTQLASWAQLRRNTILYAKQSYTSGNACEFPDAYVDPYPDFFRKLSGIAESLQEVTSNLPDSGEATTNLKARVTSWTSLFLAVTQNLAEMAENELTGSPNSEQLLDFINEAVTWKDVKNCDGTVLGYSDVAGWYFRLFLDPADAVQLDPTIADVHTQPTDEGGSDVGRILHVGTGLPRLMVVTANTCSGPRAYAGLAASYGEFVAENWERLNDEDWAAKISSEAYPDVPWMSSVLAP
jgi:hypothetical protein